MFHKETLKAIDYSVPMALGPLHLHYAKLSIYPFAMYIDCGRSLDWLLGARESDNG
jgi:hypothetical protein